MNTHRPIPLDETPRFCVNDDCQQEYAPTSNGQKWCPDCIELGDRDRLLNKRLVNAQRGRVCAWCMRTDEYVGFHSSGECLACHNRANANGRCGRCRYPLRKLGNNTGIVYCEVCSLPETPAGYLEVTLTWQGEERVVFKSPGCKLRDPSAGGRPRNLASLIHANVNGGKIVMWVTASDYVAGFTKNPLAVKGLPGWPEWLAALNTVSKKFYEDLVDLVHFLRMEDVNPVRATWWIDKFRGDDLSRESSMRSWERFKAKITALGVKIDRVPIEDTSEVGLKVDVPELARFVDQLTQMRERREKVRTSRKNFNRKLRDIREREARLEYEKQFDP